MDQEQCLNAEKAGADAVVVGVGGGGRCITGIRSESVLDWPQLVWDLRGSLNIPVIVEGGASDHFAVTLLPGVSGISVSRIIAGGTIESPGGALFYVGNNGKLLSPKAAKPLPEPSISTVRYFLSQHTLLRQRRDNKGRNELQ